jgi:tetratricopeptide (TPR) repeat protein
VLFRSDVQALELIQGSFLLFGVILPFVFVVYDYTKMMRKVREHGVYEGFVEAAKRENGEGAVSFLPMEAFNPPARDRQAGELLKDIELNPEELSRNLKKSLNRAHACMLEKDYSGAYEIYHVMVKLVNSPGLYFNLGNACYSLQNWDEAVFCYKRALELHNKKKSGNAEKSVPEGGSDLSGAGIEASAGAGAENGECEIHYNLGNALFRLKKYDKAAKSYERALKLNPSLTAVQENLALCLVGAGEKEKALDYFKAALASDTANLRLHSILAGLFTEMGRYREAEIEINDCIRLKPDGIEAYEELGKLLVRQNRLKESIEAFDNMIRLSPENFPGYYHKASACYRLGLLREAVECYRKAVRLDGKSYRSYYNMAVALEELGERREAVEAFGKAIMLKPDFVDAYNNLGVVLSTMGRYDEALEIYKEGILKNPGEHSLFLNMGIMLSETGRYREASAAFRNAIDLKPDDYETYYYLGASLTEMRHYNDAIEAYKAALKVKPSDSELYYSIATVYALLSRYDIARDNLKQAIDLNGDIRRDARTNRAFDGMRGKSDFRELVS